MKEFDKDLLAAYGECMLYVHLIEDLIRLHLSECGYFHVNQSRLSQSDVKNAKLMTLIDWLREVYKNNDQSITPVIRNLHQLRKIRNKIAHEFIQQIHADLISDSGKRDITDFLRRFSEYCSAYLKILQKWHEELLKKALKERFQEFLQKEHTLSSGILLDSEAHQLLEDLERNLECPKQ